MCVHITAHRTVLIIFPPNLKSSDAVNWRGKSYYTLSAHLCLPHATHEAECRAVDLRQLRLAVLSCT